MDRAWESANRRLAGVRVYPMPAPYRNCLIFYRIADDMLEVLAVLHGSRDIGAALEEFC